MESFYPLDRQFRETGPYIPTLPSGLDQSCSKTLEKNKKYEKSRPKIKKSPEIFGTRLGSIKANFERGLGKGIWGWAVLDTISLVDAMMPGGQP